MQGEDSIYWDSSKNRYVGAVSLGFSPSGSRIRRKVTGRTKAEVRDKLRELHQEVDSGLRLNRSYTVNDALDDWLAHGLDDVSARTASLYRDTIAPALREQLGTVRLRELTAGDVHTALTALACRVSTRTIQISRNVLVRAIRQAERDGLAARNAAALTKPPKGQRTGRPSKSLTLVQATALMDAAKGTRLEAYITLSLLTGLRTEEARALSWDHIVAWARRGGGRHPRPRRQRRAARRYGTTVTGRLVVFAAVACLAFPAGSAVTLGAGLGGPARLEVPGPRREFWITLP